MYNPFKPHVVKGSDGYFYIRKYSAFGWEFLTARQDSTVWYTKLYLTQSTCGFKTSYDAHVKLQYYYENIPETLTFKKV